MKQREHIKNTCEMLYFLKGDVTATIATNGIRHLTLESDTLNCVEFTTLRRAISYLEFRGYDIVIF